MRRIALSLSTTLALLALAAVPSGASAAVPRSFFGVMADGPFIDPGSPLNFETQARAMAGSGMGFLRFSINWNQLQPYQHFADVPDASKPHFTRRLDGHPIDWRPVDRVIGGAARSGLSVLPVVLAAPAWAAANPDVEMPRPKSDRQFARFVRGLMHRYGTDGVYWRQHPKTPERPVLRWQIWNEPDISRFWDDVPNWPAGYTAMLKQTATLMRREDPKAKIYLAGLTNSMDVDLQKLYDAGAKGSFDVAAVHPYRPDVATVLDAVGRARRVMDEHGDARRKLAVTEFSWTSARGRVSEGYGIEQSPAGQAKKVTEALRGLARVRNRMGIVNVAWYTWMQPTDPGHSSFDFSGLNQFVDGQLVPKPALAAYRSTALALQGRRAQLTRR